MGPSHNNEASPCNVKIHLTQILILAAKKQLLAPLKESFVSTTIPTCVSNLSLVPGSVVSFICHIYNRCPDNVLILTHAKLLLILRR